MNRSGTLPFSQTQSQTQTRSFFREITGADPVAARAWTDFLAHIEASSPDERHRWQETIRRDLQQDGLTFTLNPEQLPDYHQQDINPVPWVISAEQWRGVEQGVGQRARVLEALAKDMLGPRRLIVSGVIPAELIFSDNNYLHACIGLPSNMDTLLFQYAADLARGSDGQFRVVDDRTQMPAGAGYALECRTIMGRVFPKEITEMKVRRLAPYFRLLRESMLSLYQGHLTDPRVVLLTPGPYNPSYFEHAYLAAYLGYTLAQGSDLLVRKGKLNLKTLEGLYPVDILYRQVDAEFLDPLELKRDSFLGVPGLLSAMRSANVATINHPGCGLLENAGLHAFFAPLCRELLGEELILPSVATWWCGQAKECQHVCDQLKNLVVKPLQQKVNEPPIDGRFASKQQLSDLKARILSHPEGYVAQEPMSYSSLPTLVGDQIEERIGSMRSFAVAKPGGDYEVMPGALARSAGATAVGAGKNLESKGSLRDVWVLSEESQLHDSLWAEQEPAGKDEWFTGVFTSRSAENLFWVGRYAERLMRQTRLIRGMVQMEEGGLAERDPSLELSRMVSLLETYSASGKSKGFAGVLERVQKCLSSEGDPPGSLNLNLRALLGSAYAVREIWSHDTWRILTEIEEAGKACTKVDAPPSALEYEFGNLIGKLNAFYGLNANGMTRESGWSMLMLGRVIEAGLGLCELMRGFLEPSGGLAVSYPLMELALQQNENLITYRRHFRTTPQLRSVLGLFTSSEINPRSLVFYLEHASVYLNQLPPPKQPEILKPVLMEMTELRQRILERDAIMPDASGKLRFLTEVKSVLEQVSSLVSFAYFSHTAIRPRENF